jgi:RimJ/RimL family protein N-acetyltransferase
MIVSTPREPLWAWINSRLGIPWSEDFRAIGFVKSDCLAAVIAYNGFTGRACFMHSAIDDPSVINRTFVQAIFDYPFNQCSCSHIIALVGSDNHRALDINKRCGFKEIHRLAGAGPDNDDLVILQVTRAECRWIKDTSNGQEKCSSSTGLHRSSGKDGCVEPANEYGANVG